MLQKCEIKKETKICKQCNSPFICPKWNHKIFCSRKCHHDYVRGKTWEELYGLEIAQIRIKKLRLGLKKASKKISETLKKGYKEGKYSPWAKGLTMETDSRIRNISKRFKGIPKTEEQKKKLRQNRGTEIHYEEILRQTKELEKQGFRCIPIGKVIPDIIAIKNNQIFAIEVEKSTPDWEKYTDDIRKYFDDIIWILLRYNKRKVVGGKELVQ